MELLKKVGQIVTGVLEFFDQYNWWVPVGIVVCFAVSVLLLVFGKKMVDEKSPAFSISWEDKAFTFPLLPDAAGPHRLLLREYDATFAAAQPNKPPRYRVYRGVTAPCPADIPKVEVTASAKQLDGGASGTSSFKLAAFLVRRYEGYSQLVELDAATGKPKKMSEEPSYHWTLEKYRRGESFEMFLFVIAASSDEWARWGVPRVEDLAEVTIKKAK
jgi:hypothetical protein